MPDDAPVEGIACQRYAVGAEDVRGPPAPPAHAGAHGHDCEVARAAAEIPDQDPFVAPETRLVGVRGGDRFVLVHDLVEAGHVHGRPQAVGREPIEVRVRRVGEMHGAPEHDPPRRRPRRKPEVVVQVPAEERDQRLEGVVPGPDAGPLERPIGEIGLERLQEPALGLRLEILLDRGGPGDRWLPGLEVQHGGKRRLPPDRGRELHEPGVACRVGDRHGAVRGAEIDADPGGNRLHALHNPASVPRIAAAAPCRCPFQAGAGVLTASTASGRRSVGPGGGRAQ